MKILVFGKTGQLALSFADLAQRHADLEITLAGRPDTDLMVEGSAEKAMADVAPDVVVNAAAYTAVDKAESETEAAMRLNGAAAGEIAAAAAAHRLPVIHVSTDYVFDGLSRRPYREDDATGPQGVYGQSKLAGEIAVARANPRHVIARTAWVYSTQGNNFVKTMLRLGRDRPELGIVSDQIGNPTSSDDLAEALLVVARALVAAPDEETLNGVVHVAGTGIASWYDLAAHVFRIAAQGGYGPPRLKPIVTEDYPTPARRPQNSRLDTSRLKQVFGHELPVWTDSVARDVRLILSRESA